MELENVKLIKKADIYYDGKIVIRNFYLSSGQRMGLGFMLAGEYYFDTTVSESMEVLNGSLDALLPDKTEWETFNIGKTCYVPANSTVKLKVTDFVDYCNSYGK